MKEKQTGQRTFMCQIHSISESGVELRLNPLPKAYELFRNLVDIGLSRSTVKRTVSSLTEMIITYPKVGSDKDGFWAVNENISN